MVEPSRAANSYPAAPWTMHGQLWLSLFRVTEDVDELRPAGVYGAAFVSYEPGSELTYSELLVARPVRPDDTREPGRRVSIVDIWVDSPASRVGGRELWAIPKDLCDFTLDTAHRGPVSRTAGRPRWPGGRSPGRSFTDVSRAAVRMPFKGGTWQPPFAPRRRGADRDPAGVVEELPCRGHWEFDPAGPSAGWPAGAATGVVPDGRLPDELRLSAEPGTGRVRRWRAGARGSGGDERARVAHVDQVHEPAEQVGRHALGMGEVDGQQARRTPVRPVDLLLEPGPRVRPMTPRSTSVLLPASYWHAKPLSSMGRPRPSSPIASPWPEDLLVPGHE